MAQETSGYPNASGNINSFNTSNSHNISANHNNIVNINTGIEDERPKILKWLSPLEPHWRHKSVQTDRLRGVGDWLLETDEFLKWSGPKTENGCDHAVLFCFGNPGVGKTHLSSLVIDRLCDQATMKDAAVAWMYCDFLAHQEHSSTNILGSILKQLVSRGEIPANIKEVFQNELFGRDPQLQDIMDMLKTTIASLNQVYICIDALDEAAPKHRQEFLRSLQDIVRESPSTRLFFTGRPHVRDEVKRCFTEAIIFPVSPTEDDIRRYLEDRLARDTEPTVMDDELRANIMKIIPEKISEIFLLVYLNIEAILGEMTLHGRKRKLFEMTKGKGLEDAYTATLARIQAQGGSKSKLGMKLLMWVSHSERPLHVDELCDALGVETGSPDLNSDNIPAIKIALGCCLGLVAVEASSSTVRPVHFTLQEYLSENPALFQCPHSMIAEVCLTYLNFECVRNLSLTLSSPPSEFPFLKYASLYWGTHARRETSESIMALALRLLSGYDEHISSKLLLEHERRRYGRYLGSKDSPKGVLGLQGATFFGVADIIVALLDIKEWDLNVIDPKGDTALTWAARIGNVSVAEIILDRSNVDPNIPDSKYGQTPLLWAAKNAHDGVVKLLLGRANVDPNTPDTNYGQTPLLWASENGHEGVVKLLLGRADVDPNTPDTNYGQTPLLWAAKNAHDGVVKLLLGRADVDPNTPDTKYGQTPLSWASENGHEGVVKLLLGRADVDPNTSDTNYGQTPLLLAAMNGHEEVVETLLKRDDIKPNTADKWGTSSLWWALEKGHEEIAKMLLEHDNVDPNMVDRRSLRTPLSWAAEEGRVALVEILLKRDDIIPDAADKWGTTPLLWAVRNGNDEVVQMLLERGDVDLNKANRGSIQTPLSSAAEEGHAGVVKMLLNRDNIRPNTADKWHRTPLLLAVMNGHEEVVELLLGRNNVDPDTADAEYARTPLSYAAERGGARIVKMLLKRGDIKPDTADKCGRTPLWYGAEKSDREVISMLLERGDVDPNITATKYSQTQLLLAAKEGHKKLVQMLLERDDVDPNIPDNKNGRTPISYAAGNGHMKVMKTLLGRGDIESDRPDKWGLTPLCWAALNRCHEVVEILLKRGDANPETRDIYGRTPLFYANCSGCMRTVNLLSNRKSPIPEPAEDQQAQTLEIPSSEPSKPAEVLLEELTSSSQTPTPRHIPFDCPSEPLLSLGSQPYLLNRTHFFPFFTFCIIFFSFFPLVT